MYSQRTFRPSPRGARRQIELARETQFLRLCYPFNIAVLMPIVSNFDFTVEQLQNTDPARRPRHSIFEHIDLAYTLIFTLGDQTKHSKRAPTCAPLRPFPSRAHVLN
jgi:hypothetical protein